MRTVTTLGRTLMAACLIAASIAGCGGDRPSGTPPPETPAPQGPSLAGLRCSGPQQSGWCWQRPRPHGVATRDTYFVDLANGWLVGDHGLVMRSSDRGQTWSEQSLPTTAPLVRVRFADAQRGWIAAGHDGLLWRTEDGGRSWSATARAPVANATELWVVRDGTLVLTGHNGTDPTPDVTAVSEDGGRTWTRAALVVHDVEADGTLWGFGGSSRSPDLGRTVTRDPEPGWPADAFVWSVGFGDAGHAWALFHQPQPAGQPGRMLLAQRSAANQPWVARGLDAPASTTPMSFIRVRLDADGNGLAMAWPQDGNQTAEQTRFARTSQGGADWRWIDLPPDRAGDAVAGWQFVDGRTLFLSLASAQGGLSRHLTTDGGLTWRSLSSQFASRGDRSLTMQRDRGGALLAGEQFPDSGRRWRSTDQGATWTALPAPDAPAEDIAGLWMTRQGRGLAVTRAGTTYDTDDFGQRWTARANRIAEYVDALHMKDDGRGWLVADGRLWRSTDGGHTWAERTVSSLGRGSVRALLWDDGVNLRAEALAHCPSDDSTILTCYTVLHSSSDGGQTWAEGPILRTVDGFPRAVAFASADIGVVVDHDRLRRSTDGGKTWLEGPLPATRGSANRVVFQDSRRGWMVGYDGSARRTVDGGATWSVVDLPLAASRGNPSRRPWLNDVAFADAQRGWIVGDDGVVLATTDGGTSWAAQASGTPYPLTRLSVLDATTAWVGGASTAILVTGSSGRAAP